MNLCNVCPRSCNVDRVNTVGVCGVSNTIKLSKAMLHYWEEPCISGENGSGAIFFSGCNLKCCYCQNYKISTGAFGKEVSTQQLADIMLRLQEQGANNINLVTPTHYSYSIAEALDLCKHRLKVPVVYNCGGYERVDTLKYLKDYVDIFLTDFKYYSSQMSTEYSKCADYFEVTSKAVLQMHSQQPKLVYDDQGILQKGLIVRHLVLPTGRHDSINILRWLSESLPKDDFILSLMWQYTPTEQCVQYPKINRRTSTFEYSSVLDVAIDLKLNGYTQEKRSAREEYTPEFDLSGL